MKTQKYAKRLRRLLIVALVVIHAMFLVSSCTDKEAKRKAKKEEHYQKGLAFVKEGRYNEAIIEFKNAIQQDPNFANAYYQLGLAQLEQEQLSQGYGNLIKAVELDKNNIDARIRVAELYFSQGVREGDYSKAEVEIRDILELDPNNAKAYIIRARIFSTKATRDQQEGNEEAAQEKYVHALADIQKSIELNPDDIEAYIVLGQIYLVQNKPEDARQAFEKVLTIDPENVRTYVFLASIAFKDEDTDKAEELYQKVLQIDSENMQGLVGMGEIYLSKNNYDKAIETANTVLNALPPESQDQLSREEISARFILGRAYLLQATQQEQTDAETAKELYKKAKDELEVVVGAARNLASAYYSLGLAHSKLENFQQAIEQFTEVLRMNPTHIPSLMNLAIVSGTTLRSWARARRSMSISRFSFLLAKPSRAFWQIFLNLLSSTSISNLSSRSASPSLPA